MKKIMTTLIALLLVVAQASAMSYERARQEALFLTDKMAYELNLTDAQYEAAYEINLDYLMGVTSQYDVYGTYWERRNLDLQFILYNWQWETFRAATYFFRPLYWEAGYWHFGVYARYPRRDYFYFGYPHFYVSYRGGHSWRMNGNRSYYERHRDHFRPTVHRDHHVGMRDGWNRGDYHRSAGRGGSSTRVTAPQGRSSNSYRPVDATGSNRHGSDRNRGYGQGNNPDYNQGNGQGGNHEYNRGNGQGTNSGYQGSGNGYRPQNSTTRGIGSSRPNGNISRGTSDATLRSLPQSHSRSAGASMMRSNPVRSSGPSMRSMPSTSARSAGGSMHSATRGGSFGSGGGRSGASGGGQMGGRTR